MKFNENHEKSAKNFVQAQQRPEVSQEGKTFHPNFSRYEYPSRNCGNSSTDSETDAEDGAESLYDNHNFDAGLSESVWEGDEDVEESIQGLQKGLNRITCKYVRNVKSKVEGVMSRLKLNEARKAPLPKQQIEKLGEGDIKAPQTDELYKKMEMMKKDCYKKIEANLNMLKNIDNLTDEINSNLFNQTRASK